MNIQNEAKRQSEPIEIAKIKETLKQAIGEAYKKLIISEDQPVKRANFVFIEFDYQLVERTVKKIDFPLYPDLIDEFSPFEGGEEKLGTKSVMESDDIFLLLADEYELESIDVGSSNIQNIFIQPLDVLDDKIAPQQKSYFIPASTYKEICNECDGELYITCTNEECHGRHEYTCPKCHGKKKVNCRNCKTTGFLRCDKCAGKGELKCKKCNGSGEIFCGNGYDAGCGGKGYFLNGEKREKCLYCSGKGRKPCPECKNGFNRCTNCYGKGEVRCDACNGHGEIDCRHCRAEGIIICSDCYGDKEKYGKIDCPVCNATGAMAHILYVDTDVSEHKKEEIIVKGEKTKIDEGKVRSHIKNTRSLNSIYKNINGDIFDENDEYSKEYAAHFEEKFNLNKGELPMVTMEKIYYQVIPSIEIAYKHIFMNTTHLLGIVNIWDNPEVVFYDDPEKIENFRDLIRDIGDMIGSFFKTDKFKQKEDFKKQIKLLIYLFKLDSSPSDEKKLYFSGLTENLNKLTNSEKKVFLEQLNAKEPVEPTIDEMNFYMKKNAFETLEKLSSLANKNSQINEEEKTLLDNFQKANN